jgi:2-dehydropantoate 2-reductase
VTIARNGNFVESEGLRGRFDIVLLAVKAHQISALAPTLSRLLEPGTSLLTLQNGIPWWYFQGCEGEYSGTALRSLDPDGAIAAAVRPENIVGTVVYPAAEVLEDGTVRPKTERFGMWRGIASCLETSGAISVIASRNWLL